ncbi:MAG TPA: polysaccharide deacetylase family protein, partial [Actinomycetota bacterium]|nr:polysaccharide deacetylase family protein [Actinomycetota bacterium]
MWPGDARVAVAVTFDLDAEEVWIADDAANRHRPAALSQGVYGPKVAVPRIVDLLERHGIRATFFVPGRVAEAHPVAIEALVAGSQELACH